MKSIFSILTLLALALAVPATSMAAKKKPDATADDKKSDDKDAKKKDTYPYYGEVEDISDTLLTLKSKSKGSRKLDITKDTKFKKGKDAATIKDVKKGAEVGGLCKKAEDGKGNEIALSINVDVKQKGDAKDDKKTTEKKADDKTETNKAAPAKPDTTKKKKKTDASN